MMSYAPSLKAKAAAELELRKRQNAPVLATTAWSPQPGPQTAAYNSVAQQIGYGGAAGGGKSDMALGMAGTKHLRSIIFRRVFPSLRGLIERSREMFNADSSTHAKDSFNEQTHVWRLSDGRIIEFGACQLEKDRKKYQGQPHDLLVFDEATEFPEAIVRFLMAWNRSATPGVECQLLLTFNPPMDDEGQWIITFFAPWLDEDYPDKAESGEIRYVARIEDKDYFYRTPEDAPEEVRESLKTRTFFKAGLADNPALAVTDYGSTIEGLPEPLRSLLKGNFNAARAADPWQCIPSEWVKLAQERWKSRKAEGPLSAIGFDVARGGQDKTVRADWYGNYLAPLEKYPGVSTPDGQSAAALIVRNGAPECPIGVDVIGVGGSAYDHLLDNGVTALGVNFSESAPVGSTDRSGKLRFRNLRAYCYWKLREALDPNHGDDIALPDDPELRADLCAPKWRLSAQGIQIEDKDEIKARIGRSPDCADAVVIGHYVIGQSGWLVWGQE